MKEKWYSISREEILTELETNSANGLMEYEVSARLEKYGKNELLESKEKSLVQMFFDQFKDFLVIILIISTVIAAILGEWLDAGVIMAILVLNAIMGVVQEGRAEKALAMLRKMAVPFTTVIRNGAIQKVSSALLVPGDIILLQAGDLVPADLRLTESINLKIDESALTGESVPVEKNAGGILEGEVVIGDQVNMAFLGTVITYGRGSGVVTSTGMKTEIGKIAEMVAGVVEEDTPLQKKLAEFGKWLGLAALGICGLVFLLGILEGEPVFNMFMTAISLAVAAIPEGLPAIVTIVLAIGVQKMISRNAIIRRLPAVETLGCVTYICSDKTGTLTENKMTVREIYLPSGRTIKVTGNGYEPTGEFLEGDRKIDPAADPEMTPLISIAYGCNDASLVRNDSGGHASWADWTIVGDPTEGALVTMAAKVLPNRSEFDADYPRFQEIPFDSTRKRMSTLHFCPAKNRDGKGSGGAVAFIKGAPDILLALSGFYCDGGTVKILNQEKIGEITETVSEMAGRGLRVLGFAMKKLDGKIENPDPEQIEKDLTFVGLIGMIDPVRPEVKSAIEMCRKAGVTPAMVTGDYPQTAKAIGMELNMIRPNDKIITGVELENMDQNSLEKIVRDVKIYARVSPEHKLRIVKALKKHDQIVAMTGDGVNDAPALNSADIGVAMGMSGTEVAKGASDMVLTDDNFASIVAAIEEGRGIFENIRKSIIYLLSCNIGELLVFLVAIIAKFGNPLIPVQILMINLATDGLPALALGMNYRETRHYEYSTPRFQGRDFIQPDCGADVYCGKRDCLCGTLPLCIFLKIGRADRSR